MNTKQKWTGRDRESERSRDSVRNAERNKQTDVHGPKKQR